MIFRIRQPAFYEYFYRAEMVGWEGGVVFSSPGSASVSLFALLML